LGLHAQKKAEFETVIQEMFRRLDEVKLMAAVVILVIAGIGIGPGSALAAPSAETAKRCIHYSYLVYPFKRPGSAHMSGNRQAYFNDCMARDGNVPQPASTKP
jgi:hypothetical protein